tara:strand:+ start:20043 stop:20273 length:231 start_codon:yes stop_codon:yes gene_type:complete
MKYKKRTYEYLINDLQEQTKNTFMSENNYDKTVLVNQYDMDLLNEAATNPKGHCINGINIELGNVENPKLVNYAII